MDPIAESWWEAQVMEDVGDVFDINVIKEPLDVKENNGGDHLTLDSCLGIVSEAEGGVNCTVIVVGTKLGGRKDVK